MKVKIKSKYKNDTITSNDIHTNKNSLKEMIKTNSNIVKNPNPISKEDDVKKLFNRSISKTIKERQHYID